MRDGAILLKHGESFTLRRLPLGYQYTVSEGKDSAEGYTVSYSCSDSDAEIIQGEKLSASLKPGAQSAEVENKKELIPQTGIWGGGAGGFIVMAIALLGIASIIFARFLKRRGIRKKYDRDKSQEEIKPAGRQTLNPDGIDMDFSQNRTYCADSGAAVYICVWSDGSAGFVHESCREGRGFGFVLSFGEQPEGFGCGNRECRR